jgi:hypothetical protein
MQIYSCTQFRVDRCRTRPRTKPAYASGGNKYGQYCSVVKIAQTVISSYASVQSSKFRGAVAAVARLVCEELRFPSSGAFLFPKSRKSPFRGPFISDVPGLIG